MEGLLVDVPSSEILTGTSLDGSILEVSFGTSGPGCSKIR
jgi:hypothetical protein